MTERSKNRSNAYLGRPKERRGASTVRLRCVPLVPSDDSVRIELDAAAQIVTIQDHTVRLTRTEFRLLAHLIARRGCWISPADLIREVFGTHHRSDTPLVRVHVHAVRRKLRSHARWLESDSHRLLGYRWMGPRP